MLRRLRQPKTLIIAASCALLVSLAELIVILTQRGFLHSQDLPEHILLLPLIVVTDTSLILVGGLALSLLGMLIVASTSERQGKRTISTGWGWLGFVLTVPLCALSQPLAGLACLGSACLFLFAMIGRDAKWFIASVILTDALALASIAALNSVLSSVVLTQSLSLDGKQYALVTVTRSDFDICTDHQYLVMECDSLLLACQPLWQSITYGDWCGQAGFEPENKTLTYDAAAQQLLVQLDDERFTVPLEPPA